MNDAAHRDQNGMTASERAIRAFAAQFDPPLAVCATLKVNNVPVSDGWTCSYHDQAKCMGLTAIAFTDPRHGPVFHAYTEALAAATAELATEAGRMMARAFGIAAETEYQWRAFPDGPKGGTGKGDTNAAGN